MCRTLNNENNTSINTLSYQLSVSVKNSKYRNIYCHAIARTSNSKYSAFYSYFYQFDCSAIHQTRRNIIGIEILPLGLLPKHLSVYNFTVIKNISNTIFGRYGLSSVGMERFISTVDDSASYCKKLSEKDHDDNTFYSSGHDACKQLFYQPFLDQVKERPNKVMDIENAAQFPVQTLQEKTAGQDLLRLVFPVSSGQTHSLAVNRQVPIGSEESAKLNEIIESDGGNIVPSTIKQSHSNQVPKVISVETVIRPISSPNNAVVNVDEQYVLPTVEPPASVSPNAHCSYSLLSLETGKFTGHTGAKVLTPAELCAGLQTWVKRDQHKKTVPVESGIGFSLLQKIGWKPGEGLGKNKSGCLEPILPDIKIDKKGLMSEEEFQINCVKYSKKSIRKGITVEKHPVSLLNEYCMKRKWDMPTFNAPEESGAGLQKLFTVTVLVNGVQYCSLNCKNKKLAKVEAAKACLRELGLLN